MTILRARINPQFPFLVETYFSDTPDFPVYLNCDNPVSDMDRVLVSWLASGNTIDLD